jgi:serine protease inhibitor
VPEEASVSLVAANVPSEGIGRGGAAAAAREPVRLVVDRPFLFVIHDLETGTPLFIGRVDDPSSTLD